MNQNDAVARMKALVEAHAAPEHRQILLSHVQGLTLSFLRYLRGLDSSHADKLLAAIGATLIAAMMKGKQ